MKFRSKEELSDFLLEVGEVSTALSIPENYEPSTEMVEGWIKSRRTLRHKLKDFRKRQITKESWRKNRYKLMKGIKKFHKSTQGKRFHRNLGRFLATRENREVNPSEMLEAMKAITSLKTHLIAEMEYYNPIEEDIGVDILIEESFPTIDRVFNNILLSEDIEDSDLEMLLFIMPPLDIKASCLYLVENSTPVQEQEILSLWESKWASFFENPESCCLIREFRLLLKSR